MAFLSLDIIWYFEESKIISTTGRVVSIVGISLISTPLLSVSTSIKLSSTAVIIIAGFSSPSIPKILTPETFLLSKTKPKSLLFPTTSLRDTQAVISPDAINGSHFSAKLFSLSNKIAVGAIIEFPIHGDGTA